MSQDFLRGRTAVVTGGASGIGLAIAERLASGGAQVVEEKIKLEPAAIRRLIEPDEVGEVVAYLCSEAASPITGAVGPIDLGWTSRWPPPLGREQRHPYQPVARKAG